MKNLGIISKIDSFMFLRPLLKRISDGKFFNTIFSWLLRGLAFVTILGILWVSWTLWGSLSSKSPINIFIGALLAEVFLVVMGYVIFNIFWIRAEDISILPLAKDYSITPIVVILIKATGEIFATLSALTGLAIGVTSWIADPRIMRSIPLNLPLPGISGGGSGALPLVSGIIFGFIVLALAYFFAETSGALVDIARNTKARPVKRK